MFILIPYWKIYLRKTFIYICGISLSIDNIITNQIDHNSQNRKCRRNFVIVFIVISIVITIQLVFDVNLKKFKLGSGYKTFFGNEYINVSQE